MVVKGGNGGGAQGHAGGGLVGGAAQSDNTGLSFRDI